MKDDSGSYAIFTEQGLSASQVTAAKVMDIRTRLPGCSGQAADAVSACTQVKMEDVSTLFKNPKSECPDIWIRLPNTNVLNHGPLWKGNTRKLFENTVGKKIQTRKDIVDNCRNTFESKISAGAKEKLPSSEKLLMIYIYIYIIFNIYILYIYCERANITTEQVFKLAAPCIDDHQFKEEEMGSVKNVKSLPALVDLIYFANWRKKQLNKYTKSRRHA